MRRGMLTLAPSVCWSSGLLKEGFFEYHALHVGSVEPFETASWWLSFASGVLGLCDDGGLPSGIKPELALMRPLMKVAHGADNQRPLHGPNRTAVCVPVLLPWRHAIPGENRVLGTERRSPG